MELKALLDALAKAKQERFTDARTWRTSGPEYYNAARDMEAGWDEAVEALKTLLAKENQVSAEDPTVAAVRKLVERWRSEMDIADLSPIDILDVCVSDLEGTLKGNAG